jgi:hypothetical protein
MKTKEPILLFRDAEVIEKAQKRLTTTLNAMNEINKEFKTLDIGEIESFEDYDSIARDVQTFCYNKYRSILPENAIVAGLKVSKEKLFDLCKPEGMNRFIDIVKNGLKFHLVNVDYSLFNFSKNNITLKANAYKEIEEKYSIYIDNPKREEFYNTVMRFKESFEQFNEKLSENNAGFLTLTSSIELLGTRVDNNAFFLNEKTLRNIISKL